jgi:hypothetical protein
MAKMIGSQAENALIHLPESEPIAELRSLIDQVINRQS